MDHAVELVALADHFRDPLGEAGQVLLVLHVKLEQWGLLRQPVRDALDQPQPVEPVSTSCAPCSWATRAM